MIYFFGDTHGCFEHVIDVVEQDRPAAIVFLGDLQAQRPLVRRQLSWGIRKSVWAPGGADDGAHGL